MRTLDNRDLTRIDLALAVIVGIGLELELRDQTAHRAITVVMAALVAAPVGVRRRWPAGALVASTAIALAQGPLGVHLTAANGLILPPILLFYGAGAWLGRRASLAALGAGGALFGGLVLSTPTPHSVSAAAAEVVFAGLLCAGPWAVGRIVRTPIQRAHAFRALAHRAAAEVAAHEQAAVAEERERIGRELQDIIAHSVSAMVVQAGGARQLVRSDPDRARASIVSIEQAGREALVDLRRLLGMLRREDDPRALAPQPGLHLVGGLVDATRAAGARCNLLVEGAASELTPGVDMVAYRIVEAALAGAGSGSSGAVTLRHLGSRVELEVVGDWKMDGLDAVAQRVALYDGRLELLPALRGFALRASLVSA